MLRYRLSAPAQQDIIEILAYTTQHFGEAARRRYETLLVKAFQDVAVDPHLRGSRLRPDIGVGVLTYHLRHTREHARSSLRGVRSPRHFLLYRVISAELVGIGRILHDAMDVERHLPAEYGEEE